MKSKSKFLLALLLCGTMLAGCGEQGEQGLPGNKGTNGTNGKDGLSAYELYCQEYDYKGSLTEWLEKFYSEDTTDYTKYDDFLFTEVTYGGVVGYAANYIGGNEKIVYPSTFKKLPVLLAGIGDVTYLPNHDLDDELPALKEIHYPSSIKVISVSDIVTEKFDVSELKLYFEASIERYEAPYYAKEVYFEGDSLEAYLATNLRKYFTFSDVYVKDSEGYTKVINGQEKASDFLDEHYDMEGGIYDQIKEIMGGSTEFYKFGSFELTFPKKFTVNYENYDIDLPFNIVGLDLENHDGVTFEKGVLKGDASKYINKAYTLVGNVDLGIPGWRLHELTFNLFKEAKTIKVGDETLYKMDDDSNSFTERGGFVLNEGTYNIVVYDENNEVITRKIPLKASEGMEIDFVNDNSRTAINLKGTAEYGMLIDLDTFVMKIMPRNLETGIGDMILSSFKNENGFIGSPGIGLLRKELYLPKNRVIDVNGIKYSVDLTYNIEKDYCEDIDEEHKAIIYNAEKDYHANGYNEYFVKISYSIPNDFLRGYFDYHVKMYGMNSAPTLGLNLHLGEEETKAHELFLDYEQQIQLKTVFRLNEVNIDCEKFALTINGGEALYKLATGSLGEIKDCYYQIESGVYNLTLDLDNNTLMIEESNDEYINKVKVGFFEHLKEEGFNVYVEDADNIVLFDTSKSNSVDKTFDIEESDTVSIEAHVEIKEGNYYSIASEDEHSTDISLGYSFSGIQDDDPEKGFVVSIRADGYFIDVEDVLFHCAYRHCPANKEDFHIEDVDSYETVIDGNVFYLNNVYLDSDWYQIHLQSYNPDYPMTFHFEGGEGQPFSINDNLRLIVPSSRFGHHYNFVFNFNKLTVTVDQID